MYKWNNKFEDISLVYEDKVIRVLNDQALDLYLQSGEESAIRLASFIRKAYERKYNKPLKISCKSLAIEIYGHYRLQKLMFAIEKYTGQIRFTRWMLRHMDVIDCGEASEDNNRFVWDILAWL